MITYDKTAFGLNLIFRVHGSAIYRAAIPGLLSVLCLILIRYLRNGDGTFTGDARDSNDLQHPYAIGILVVSTTFLIVFRSTQGYNRYWEAAGAIHHMTSKWLDATTHTGCYHMQCSHYDAIKPPSFFDYPELNAYYLTRDRERYYQAPMSDRSHVLRDLDEGKLAHVVEAADDSIKPEVDSNRNMVAEAAVAEAAAAEVTTIHRTGGKRNAKVEILDRAMVKSIEAVGAPNPQVHAERTERLKRRHSFGSSMPSDAHSGTPGIEPIPLTGAPRLDGNWGKLFPDKKATYYQPNDTDPSSPNYLNNMPSFASNQGGRTPALFLQELAHLCSLLNAVAMSTLRNDMEGSVSPLGVYKPGSPWPEVDPDKIDSSYLKGPWYSRFARQIGYFFGAGRSPQDRTRYNAARPLEVLGGVSDAEIRFLQMARGASAKTQLCWYWLTEFIIREHLNGSTGKVGPPIISRIIQFLSDGMIFYNHARKIMFIPFPFPHAQLAVFFILVAIPAVAFLMDQYADNIILGSILSFCSVTCLSGIHEVARELENPFRNIPNELPLVTLQAQLNESLVTMYSGYHPDHFWDPKRHDHHPSDPPHPRRKHSKNRTSSTSPKGISRSASGDSLPRPVRKSDSKDESKEAKGNSPPSTAVPANKSPEATTSPNASPPETPVNGDAADLAKLTAKMEEYGKEIERLRGLLQDSGEKKSN